MPLLAFKKQQETYVLGCERCGFAVRNPRIGESIGEYIAASRTAYDCRIVRSIRVKEPARIWVVASQNGTIVVERDFHAEITE